MASGWISKIDLFDGYVILIDKFNWALGKDFKVDKRGYLDAKIIGYYSTLQNALKAFKTELVKNRLAKRESLESILTYYREEDKRLEKFIQENFPALRK